LDNKINKYDAYNSTIQKIEKDITTLSNFTTDQHTHNSINDNNINLLQSLYYQANTNIKNLTTSVSTNVTNINTNTSQILTNTSQISTNQSKIGVIESSISGITNSGLGIIISKNIWSLTNTYLQFANSSSYIAVPTINLRSVTSNPPGKILFGSGTTNVQNFAYNDVERILCQSVPTIVNNVTTNTNNIINVNTNIGTLQSDINKIQGNILTNDNDIATLQVAVTANNNQISTLTSLQNNDLANFVAIDNNFINVSNSISAINTKLTDFQYVESSNGITTIQNNVKIMSTNSVIFIEFAPLVTGDGPDTGMSVIKGRASASTIIRAGGNGLEFNQNYNEGLLFSGNSSTTEPGQMTLDLNGNLLIGTDRNKMLPSTIYKLNVDGNTKVNGNILCNSIITNNIRSAYSFKKDSVQIASGSLDFKTFDFELDLTFNSNAIQPINFLNAGETYIISAVLRTITIKEMRVCKYRIKILSGGNLIYQSDECRQKLLTTSIEEYQQLSFPAYFKPSANITSMNVFLDCTTFANVNSGGSNITYTGEVSICSL
jgi:hypothetical protein